MVLIYYRYTLLCGTVDQLVEGAIQLRQVMGLPSQTSGQPLEETAPDADAQVLASSQNASPGNSHFCFLPLCARPLNSNHIPLAPLVPTGKRDKRGSKQKEREARVSFNDLLMPPCIK